MKFLIGAFMVLAVGWQEAVALAQQERTVQCRALDAQGNPIPKALIQAWTLPSGRQDGPTADSTAVTTDDEGNFTFSERQARSVWTVARLLHPDYGTAEVMVICGTAGGVSLIDSSAGAVYFPLVKKGSEEEKNALHGTVVDPDNQPVAGARVAVSGVLVPDGRLIQAGNCGYSFVYTDKAGRFSIYPLPYEGRKAAVVPYSTYSIIVIQPSYALFPNAGNYRNSDQVVIHLGRPELAHHFVFTGPDGLPLSAEDVLRHTTYLAYRDKSENYIMLPARFKTEPVKLMPGRYEVAYDPARTGVQAVNYPAVEVTKDSPEELVFRYPAPVSQPSKVPMPTTGALPPALLKSLTGDEVFAKYSFYSEKAVLDRLSHDGPSTDALKAILDKMPHPEYWEYKFWLRNYIIFSGKPREALSVLQERSKQDEQLRYYLLTKRRLLCITLAPSWTARNMTEEMRKELWRELDQLAAAGGDPATGPGVTALLRVAARFDFSHDQLDLEVLDKYASGKTKTSVEASSLAAMILIEAGHRREEYESILRQRLDSPQMFPDGVGVWHVLLEDALETLRTRFSAVVVPEDVCKAIQELPQANRLQEAAKTMLLRSCSFTADDGRLHGARLLNDLLQLRHSGSRSDNYLLNNDDRLMLIGTFAQWRMRDDHVAYRMLGNSWSDEPTPLLRFGRYLLRVYGRDPQVSPQQFEDIVKQLSPEDRAKYALSITCGRAYLNAKDVLHEFLREVAAKPYRQDEFAPKQSLFDLIRGTDYGAFVDRKAFADWALGHMDDLRHDEGFWTYAPAR